MTGTRFARLAAFAVVATTSVEAQQPPEWRIGSAPVLTLEDNGAPGTEFHRYSSAWRLPDGRIVVANGGSLELRIFDSSGTLVESYGRAGKGPGEFERMAVIGIVADTTVIYDFAGRRATTVKFGAKTQLVSTVTMTASGIEFGFDVTGRLSDGRWIATTGMGIPGGWDAPKGVTRAKGKVVLVPASGGGSLAVVADVPGMASISYMPSDDKKKWVTGFAAFAPNFHGRVSAGTLWFGDSGGDSLVRLDAKGQRQRIALPLTASAPSPQIVEATKGPELQRARRGGSGDYIEFKYSAENLPARLPTFGGLLAGTDGELWVREYSTIATAPDHFLVLDAQGRAIARVTTPPGFRATHVSRDFVVGLTQDADEIEGVKMYRLIRGSR